MHIHIILAAIALCVHAESIDLPSYFPKCSRDDPELNQCLIKAGNALKPHLIKGIPELDIQSIKEYFVPEAIVEYGIPAVHFKSVMHNTTLYGLQTYDLKQLDYDIKNGTFFGRVAVAPLFLSGRYKIDSNILTLPLKAEGDYTANITHLEATLNQNVDFITRDGEVYIKSSNVLVHVDVNANAVKLQLDGLSVGNKVVDTVLKDIITNHIQEIIEDVRPVCESIMAQMMETLLDKIHSKVPYDRLYPPNKSKN